MIPEGVGRLLMVCFTSVVISCIVIYSIGLDNAERNFIQEKVFSKVVSKCHKQ